MNNCQVTKETVTFVIKGTGDAVTLKKGSEHFEAVKAILLTYLSGEKEGEIAEEEIVALMSPARGLALLSKGNFEFKNNELLFRGIPLRGGVGKDIIELARADKDPTRMMRFYERLSENPSWRSVEQTWGFLKKGEMSITRDGLIVAYKGVRADFRDKHSGTILNTPGSLIRVDRNKVSDDPTHACHFGLHVGNKSYASSFAGPGGKMVLVAVDPKDIVCIPNDSSQKKMRCCEYRVLAEFTDKTVLNDFLEDDEPILHTPTTRIVTEVGESGRPQQVIHEDVEIAHSPETEGWLNLGIDEMRKYARSVGVKNPNGIKGGKTALIESIRAALRGSAQEAPNVPATETGPEARSAPEQKEVTEGREQKLMAMTLDEVRNIAKEAGIKNVRSIIGGKAALVKLILSL
jgi:hypothetical protein